MSAARAALRWSKRILVTAAAAAVMVLALLVFLLGTASGGKLALKWIVLPLLPIEAEIAGLAGRLWGGFELRDAEVRLAGVEAHAELVRVRWRPLALLGRHVDVETLEIRGVDLRIYDAPENESAAVLEEVAEAGATSDPPLADLPVRVSFDSVDVEGIQASVLDSITLQGGRLRLAGSLEEYSLVLEGTARESRLGPVDVAFQGEGTPTQLQVAELRAALLDGSLHGSGDIQWWPAVSWRLAFRGDTLRPAALMPEPDEWPGKISIEGSTSGEARPETGLALQASVDTLGGELRGERIQGRLSGRLAGDDLRLEALSVVFGPARLSATGTYAEGVDLEFQASPGSAGSFQTWGRVSGTPEEPRVVADFLASDIRIDGARAAAAEAEGRVDLDLSAGGDLSAALLARRMSLLGKDLDSVTVELSGTRSAHALAVRASGADAWLRLEAKGRLEGRRTWRGTLGALELAEDSIVGAWTLDDPAEIMASPDSIRIADACLVSPPARLCLAGSHDRSGDRITVDVEELDLSRATPFLPGDVEVVAVLQARADIVMPDHGAITGHVEARTSPGEVILKQGDRVRRLAFAPASLVLGAGAESVTGSVDLALSDTTGVPVVILTGRMNAPAVAGLSGLTRHAVSGRAVLRVADLALLPMFGFGDWTVDGALIAAAEFQMDEANVLTGTVEANAAPVTLSRVARGRQLRTTIEPARLDVIADEVGVRGEVSLAVAIDDGPPVLVATGTASLPGLTRLDADLEAQPVNGRIEVRTSDLSWAEGLGDMVTEADGRFELDADLGGTLGDMTVVGDARLEDGRVVLPDLGVELEGMQFTASGDADGGVTVSGELFSGGGRVVLEGSSATAPSAETPTRVAIRGERFQVMDTPEIQLQADPDLSLSFDGSTATVTGQVRLPNGRLEFREIPEGAATRSADVVIVGDTLATRETRAPVGLDVRILLEDDIFFSGFGVNSRLGGDLRIQQDPGGAPQGRGEIQLIDGTFRQFGQELSIEPGRLVFVGPLDNPNLDVRAFVRARDGTEAGLRIGGTLQQLVMETYSRPQKSESETMSYILFGRGLNQTTGSEGNQANNAAAILGANVLAMSLAPSVGLDEARIETGSSQNKAQFVMGKYLSPKLYVGYGVGLYEPISTFRIRYLLSSKWSIETISGDERATDLLYRSDTGVLKSGKAEPNESDAAPRKTDDADPS
jgi:translocation and assembly module TamB